MASGSSGVKKDAFQGFGTSTGQATGAFDTANPIYTQMAKRPQGYTPQEIANQETASNQTLGGANASVAGTAGLAAARTNNAGGYQAAIDDSARQAAAEQSQNNLGILNHSADLKRQQEQEGLAGLSGEFGTASGNARGYLDIANQAKPAFWQQLALAGTAAAGQAIAGRH